MQVSSQQHYTFQILKLDSLHTSHILWLDRVGHTSPNIPKMMPVRAHIEVVFQKYPCCVDMEREPSTERLFTRHIRITPCPARMTSRSKARSTLCPHSVIVRMYRSTHRGRFFWLSEVTTLSFFGRKGRWFGPHIAITIRKGHLQRCPNVMKLHCRPPPPK